MALSSQSFSGWSIAFGWTFPGAGVAHGFSTQDGLATGGVGVGTGFLEVVAVRIQWTRLQWKVLRMLVGGLHQFV